MALLEKCPISNDTSRNGFDLRCWNKTPAESLPPACNICRQTLSRCKCWKTAAKHTFLATHWVATTTRFCADAWPNWLSRSTLRWRHQRRPSHFAPSPTRPRYWKKRWARNRGSVGSANTRYYSTKKPDLGFFLAKFIPTRRCQSTMPLPRTAAEDAAPA